MSDEEEREEVMRVRTPLREDVQQLEKGISFGSEGEGGKKEEGEMTFSQWMDILMSMTEEQYAVYTQYHSLR
jgi:hypothetical protein